MAGFMRMHDQLRSLWKARDRDDQPHARGLLLTRVGNERKVAERWFALVGHALFYCSSRDAPEFSGVFLTDIFSPVISWVDEKTLEAFEVSASCKKANLLHLRATSADQVEVLLCPQSPDEKQLWMGKMQIAGLNVPTRQLSDKRKDGREKVVVIGGKVNERLYSSPSPNEERSSLSSPWKQEWRRVVRKVLATSDAAQVRQRIQVMLKLVHSEQGYVQNLSIISKVYHKQLRLAVQSGHLSLRHEQLDAIFLNCESLLVLHQLFLSHLEKTVSSPSPRIGEIFDGFVPHMTMYVEFVKNHERSVQTLDGCLNNPSFTAFLENHHSSRDCEAQQLRQLLHTPATRLNVYCSFLEELLRYTSEEHVDYQHIGSSLQNLHELKQGLVEETSESEYQQRLLEVLEVVGSRGFLLLEPDCSLVLEGDMHIPVHTKWGTGRRRSVHCYLYSNALVVMSREKKPSLVFPLAGASVYQHVSRTGAVTYAKDPDIEIKAMKIYSPDGPRSGLVVIFDTQSAKKFWLAKISEIILQSTVEPELPSFPLHPLHAITTSLPTSSSSPSFIHLPLTPTKSPHLPHRPTSTCRPPPGAQKPAGHVPVLRSASHQPTISSPNLQNRRFSGASPSSIPRSVSIPHLSTGDASPQLPRSPQYYSVPELFSKLTTDPPSPRYPDTFLLTYRMFTNPHEVLDALIEEHRNDLDNRQGKETTLTTQTLRFFQTLKSWVHKYYVDFHHDVTLKRVLVIYLDNIKQHKYIHEKESELADGILRAVSQRGHIPLTRRSKLRLQFPRSLRPVPASFAEVSAESLAAQLTWLEHETYSRIKPYEFLQQKWTKKNRQELAPNICFVILRFNRMTAWIAKEILSQNALEHRAAVIHKMLQVAEECLKMNNYVTVFQITSALSSGPTQRLKKTWEFLPHVAKDQFEGFKRLTSLEGGSKIYRERQRSSPSPSVPYIGPYLNQLISAEVGMPTFVKNPPECVNYSKLVRLAAIIEEITRFQNPRYQIEADGTVLTYLDLVMEAAESFDEDKRYHKSLQLEPRESLDKTEKTRVQKERTRESAMAELMHELSSVQRAAHDH